MKKKKNKVLVAMSGGVDSSVAAFLLKDEGYDTAGVTMCFGKESKGKNKNACCGTQAIQDAKRVARKLKIHHHVLDYSKNLEKDVIDKFVSEYEKGRTPNPCVDCNRKIKFDALLKKAKMLGFDYLATGHYAKVVRTKNGYTLKRADDRKKDQSYFLYPIPKAALKSIIFPLGNLSKDEVRGIARAVQLPVAGKEESQDICFIPDRNYGNFVSHRIGKRESGKIVLLDGTFLGEHKGAFFYTIGQRGGLGIGYKHPLYVLEKNAKENKLVVGKKEDLKAKGLVAQKINFLIDKIPSQANAQIRYNQKEARCKIIPEGKALRVLFKEKQEAITPGQSVVFYKDDTCLGGGVIDKVIR